MMNDNMSVSGRTTVQSAESVLKPLEEVAHKAGAAVGVERPNLPCPIPRPFLKHIADSADVKKIPMAYLPELAAEIRQKIDQTVQQTGGHLASNLGVTELTIALHRVFDFPHDRLIFDVGHQIYPHKLLSGRYHQFETLRQKNGISGYPNPHESEYDIFTTGHAGCAVSSALGISVGDRLMGRSRRCVAVVGDGALTSGLVFEALNHTGELKEDLLVILNDNGISISPTTGALSATCSNIRANHLFQHATTKGKALLEKIPYVGNKVEKLAEHALEAVNRATQTTPGAIFMDLGFHYYGPVDGHDIEMLARWLTEMKTIKGPKLLHVVTRKGYGLPWAAKDPIAWHGARPYEVEGTEARVKEGAPTSPPYTKIISDAIVNLARTNEKIVAITAAMPDGTGLASFQKAFPKRYFDVGICEQHAISFAAALARSGLHPIACIYSSFMQRSVDQVMHEISLQDGLPVVLCLDRAGLVGDDGPTHHGIFDIAYMRSFPFMTLISPKDQPEAEAMVQWAVASGLPVAIRYARENVPSRPLAETLNPIQLGKGEIVRHGEKVAVLGYGSEVAQAMVAATMIEKQNGLKITVANARFCKPFDGQLLAELIATHDRVITAEDHQLMGGFGCAALETANDLGIDARKISRLGIPDRYIQHGPRAWQLAQCGLDAEGIVRAALAE
ncbi:MAG: 1-deoxy-D-xylulose-5-phosphate synthase [Planctomycetota bacterium]